MQLFIILRAAKGRGVTDNWPSRVASDRTTVQFSHSVLDGTCIPEQDIHTCPVSEKMAVDVSVA